MKFAATLSLAFLAASASAEVLSLTSESYLSATSGKAVFIKFFAPWCGHCKAMAEDWEKLAADFENNANGLVAEVDCTTEEAQDLCQHVGVQGFPTIKFGDPADLEDYNGGRSYEELSAFATENLKPICSPTTVENCDDEMKQKIATLMEMSAEEIMAATTGVEEKMLAAEEELEKAIEGLQATYEGLMANFDETIKTLKVESGYGLLRSVLATKQPPAEAGNDEL